MSRKHRPGRTSPWSLVLSAATPYVVLALVVPALAAKPSVAPLPAEDAAKTEKAEHWYRVEIAGQPAGWTVTREVRRGEQRISETHTEIAIKRGGAALELEMASRFVETLDGRPILAWSRQLLGQTPIEVTYEFEDDGVKVRTVQGEKSWEDRRPRPEGEWLTPFRAQGAIVERLAGDDESFTIPSLDPLFGLRVIETTWKRERGLHRIKAGEESFETYRFAQSMDVAPGLVTAVEITADGLPVSSTTPLMGIEMTAVLSDRETALDVAGAPELLVQSFVYPDRPIERPRVVRRARYRIRAENGKRLELPSVGDQRVRTTGDRVEVTVELGSSPELELETVAPFLVSSAFVDHHAPVIHELRDRALAGLSADAGRAARAEALRVFVGEHLSEKNLNSLLATATEVAESRAGDCTEHSVLLTALLRAAGIPARLVTGLVYVDSFVGQSDLFGYHMWVQAYDDRWLDLDATTPERFDAAHIAFATTLLDDDQSALMEMATIVPLIGAIEVEVVEVEY